MIPRPVLHQVTLILRWTARLLGLLVFLFWGAFFVEHLAWFAHPSKLPPAAVFFGQTLHFLMLAGLILAWKWEIPGALLVLATSFIFFYSKAGENFLLFFGITAIPAILFLTVAFLDHTLRNPARLVPKAPGQ